MTEKTEFEAEAAAEKAYAAAAEALPVTASPASAAAPSSSATPTAGIAPEVVFPSKAKRAPKSKSETLATPVPAATASVSEKLIAAAVEKAVPPAKSPKGSSLETPSLDARTTARKVFKKTTPVAQAKHSPTPKPTTIPTPPKAAAPTTTAPKSVFQQLKEKTMETTQSTINASTTDFTTKIKGAVADAQVKAKQAFDKGAATFGEYNEFTKGNVEAAVASGKILATGMQSLGKTLVDDGKSAFETLTADVKELSSVKSPTDFFKLQMELLRRNFDFMVANTSKNSEAVTKLATEAVAPLSARVNLAVEKVKQAA